jgi:hypothetical protein
MVQELLHHARKVPSLPLAREMDLGPLVQIRQLQTPHSSWTAIFAKAYAQLARTHAELRRALIPWPRPHLYEHPISEAAFLIEREWQGEQVVLGAKVRGPENLPLGEIDRCLRRFRESPVLEIAPFRQILRLGRLPWLVRRFTLWQSLYLSGYKRAKRLGTFMISSLGNLGVEQVQPLTPLTTYLTFGPISPDGRVVAKIIYDHRVMDGRTVARCLIDLEQVLREDMVKELREAVAHGLGATPSLLAGQNSSCHGRHGFRGPSSDHTPCQPRRTRPRGGAL